MELRHLRSFIAAIEKESFTKAAQIVGVTQAAVSQHVAALEKELGIALFRRTGRAVVPTPTGRQFYASVCQALDILESAGREAKESRNPVACSETQRVAS